MHGNMQAHHAYMYCIRAQRVIKLQIMYQAPILATVLKNKYIPSCMVHRRRIRKKIPNWLPARAAAVVDGVGGAEWLKMHTCRSSIAA